MTSRDLVLALLIVVAMCPAAAAQESVTVSLPSTVTFTVTTSASVTGTPNPTTVTFASAILLPGRALRLSVKADAGNFIGPGGSSYPASAVSWTVSGTSGGTGSAGTLSSGSYNQVFQSNILTLSGQFNVRWTFSPSAGGSDYAGAHSLTLRWRIESVTP
jgi:hypothetical protein